MASVSNAYYEKPLRRYSAIGDALAEIKQVEKELFGLLDNPDMKGIYEHKIKLLTIQYAKFVISQRI